MFITAKRLKAACRLCFRFVHNIYYRYISNRIKRDVKVLQLLSLCVHIFDNFF